MPALKGKLAGAAGGAFAWLLWGFVRLLGRARALRLAESPRFTHLLARTVNLVLRKKNHCFERNLRLVFPGIDAPCIAALHDETWRNNARVLVETAFLHASEADTMIFTGVEHLKAAGDSGILFVTAHLHTMYYVPLGNRHLGYPTTFLHRAMDHPWQEALSRRLLGHLGQAVSTAQVGRFVRHLRDGDNIAITPDLRVKNSRYARRLSFCGQPAWTSTFVAEMALAHGRPVIPTYILRHPDNRIEQVFEPAIDLSSGDPDTVQQLINDSISARVLAQPGAWSLWNTNRWGP